MCTTCSPILSWCSFCPFQPFVLVHYSGPFSVPHSFFGSENVLGVSLGLRLPFSVLSDQLRSCKCCGKTNASAWQELGEPAPPHLLALFLMLHLARRCRMQLSLHVPRSSSRDMKCAGLDWHSSSGDGDTCHLRLPAPWVSSSSPSRRLWTAACRRHRPETCRQASSRPLPLTLTTPLPASAPWTARCGSVWRTLSRVTEKTTATGSMLCPCNFSAQRAGVAPSWRICALVRNWSQTARNRRFIVFWHLRYVLVRWTNGRRANCRSYPGTLALHGGRTRAHWQVTSKARGLRARRGRFCHRRVSGRELPRDHAAPLPCTPQQGHL